MRPVSLACLLLLALPFFAALDTASVWDSNEAYYAQTPREMIERGDWIVPSFNGQPRVNKPPLSYWVVAAFYRVFSPQLFWERFPMALAAYGAVWAVFWIGRVLGPERSALLAALFFATGFRFMILARRLLIDILMLACLLAAVGFFLSWLKNGKRIHLLAAAFCFGLAFLAKGPVALLPALVLGLYLLASGRLGTFRNRDWIWAGGLFLLVSSSWFLCLALRLGPDVVWNFFLEENLGRYTHLDLGPRRGPFYYLGVFLVDFFPWSLLFGAAALQALKERRLGGPRLLLLIWIGAYFLFFSFSHNKQEYYLLPLYPAAALWVAFYLEERAPPAWFLSGVSILMLILGSFIYLASRQLFLIGTAWIPPLFLGLSSLFLLRRRWPAAALSLALFYGAGFYLYLEPLERYRPVRHFAETIQKAELEQGQPVRAGYFQLSTPSLAFYLDRPILELHRAEDAVAALESEQTVFLILEPGAYGELESRVSSPLRIVEARPRLYTTARVFLEGFPGGWSDFTSRSLRWTRPVYLISNR